MTDSVMEVISPSIAMVATPKASEFGGLKDEVASLEKQLCLSWLLRKHLLEPHCLLTQSQILQCHHVWSLGHSCRSSIAAIYWRSVVPNCPLLQTAPACTNPIQHVWKGTLDHILWTHIAFIFSYNILHTTSTSRSHWWLQHYHTSNDSSTTKYASFHVISIRKVTIRKLRSLD